MLKKHSILNTKHSQQSLPFLIQIFFVLKRKINLKFIERSVIEIKAAGFGTFRIYDRIIVIISFLPDARQCSGITT